MVVRRFALSSIALAALVSPAQMAGGADLPSAQRCQAYGPPIVQSPYFTLLTDWCDPGNRNLLQFDAFVKLANGTKGAYRYSETNISCSNSSVPRSVYDQLCR